MMLEEEETKYKTEIQARWVRDGIESTCPQEPATATEI